jgi:hypothetical protein
MNTATHDSIPLTMAMLEEKIGVSSGLTLFHFRTTRIVLIS